MSTTAASATLQCVIVTPEATVLDEPADFVALPLFDGEVGIGRSRSPMIGRLGFGELRLRRGTETDRYYVDGGFVQVTENVVSVLTNRAVQASAVDAEIAQEQLQSALSRKPRGDEEISLRDRVVQQARAQLRVVRRAK